MLTKGTADKVAWGPWLRQVLRAERLGAQEFFPTNPRGRETEGSALHLLLGQQFSKPPRCQRPAIEIPDARGGKGSLKGT